MPRSGKILPLLLVFAAACAGLAVLPPGPAQAGTSRRLPLTYNETTVYNYSGITSWLINTSYDMAAAQCGEVLNIAPGIYIMGGGLTFNAGAGKTNADYFRVIRTAPGYEERAILPLDYSYYQAGKIQIVNEDYVGIYDLKIIGGGLCGPTSCAAVHIIDSEGIKIVGNVFPDITVNIECDWQSCRINHIDTYRISRTTGAYVVNNIFYGGAPESPHPQSGSIFFGQGSEYLYLYNNTFTGCLQPGYFYFGSSPSVLCTNNIRYGNVSDDYTTYDTIGSGAYTITTEASSGIVFVDAGGDDYHIMRSSTGAVNLGTDLSSDAVYPFNDDIDGDTRPSGEDMWDIGADEASGYIWRKVISIY